MNETEATTEQTAVGASGDSEAVEAQDSNRQRRSFLAQIDHHSVALISLLVALIGLGYNTWRNETTEIQRNQRWASFNILQELGELQQIVDHRHYFYSRREREHPAIEAGSQWVEGWGKVTLIRDLTGLLPAPLPGEGERLYQAWDAHAGNLELGPDAAAGARAEDVLTRRIDSARDAVKALLRSME